jgi:hypothetical protein
MHAPSRSRPLSPSGKRRVESATHYYHLVSHFACIANRFGTRRTCRRLDRAGSRATRPAQAKGPANRNTGAAESAGPARVDWTGTCLAKPRLDTTTTHDRPRCRDHSEPGKPRKPRKLRRCDAASTSSSTVSRVEEIYDAWAQTATNLIPRDPTHSTLVARHGNSLSPRHMRSSLADSAAEQAKGELATFDSERSSFCAMAKYLDACIPCMCK